MFEWMGFDVSLIKADVVNDNLLDNFSVICFPGGDMYQYSQDVSSTGKKNVRDFISRGGAYVGICGGSYFTGREVYWKEQMIPMEPLSIFPGTTRGPINDIAQHPECIMCKVNIVDSLHPITETESDTSWILYCYGPMFIPDDDADISILARYDIGGMPMMAAFDYGSGRVFIIGTHPEFEEDSERDGLPVNDRFNDCGSDWDLMKRAVDWCIER